MCGIAGIFAYGEAAPPVNADELLRVREAMRNRGPDGEGLWISADQRTGFAHRRLAIIDLSNAGAQPMVSGDGRLVTIFNGEIYNHRELRSELETKGYVFRSQSDTEVLLHLYADRGEKMVHALRGMFAFAIWDTRAQSLFLARDPFGIKPLYYADGRGTFRFASQVKALLKGGGVDTEPEPAGSVGFLVWGTVPEPYTIYRGIRALPAGGTLRLARDGRPDEHAYFNVRDEFLEASAKGPPTKPQVEVVGEALRDSIRHHLVSDVPVGVFLSAGMDSSTVTGLAVEEGAKRLHTLTLGFREYRGTDYDEVRLAEQTAARFGTRHETRWVTRDEFNSDLQTILDAMDQPTTDGVNTYLVSKAAAQAGMKVALSGLGGDELFGGYPSFRHVPRIAEWLKFAAFARPIGKVVRAAVSPLLGRLTSPKLAGLLEYGGNYAGAYLLRRSLFMPWELEDVLDPTTVEVGLERLDTLTQLARSVAGIGPRHARVATLEMQWYMKNQLLRDADWAGMAHSLEIRVPLVDVRLFRALAPLLVSGTTPTKRTASDTLQRGLPEEVLVRQKTGFATPLREWLAGRPGIREARGLRGWAIKVMPPQPRMFPFVPM